MKKTPQALIALGLGAALPAALAWYYDCYVNWKPRTFVFAFIAVAAALAGFTLFTLWARGERKAKALLWKTLLSVFVFAGVILFAVSFVINNVIYDAHGAARAAAVALPLAGVQILVLFLLLLRALRRPALGAGMAAIMLLAALLGFGGPIYMDNIKAPPPPGLAGGQFAPRGPWGGTADFTVSPGGMSIEGARDAIREARIDGDERNFSVEIAPGEYNIKQIVFDERDYGTTYSTRGEGDEAILSGGMRLAPGDFAPWEENENIQVIDLTKLGLTAEDWGKMYSFGAFTTAAKYDGGVGPLPCELFFNGVRCVTARWPNGPEWLEIGRVLDNGDSRETYQNGTVVIPGWDELRNPRGGTFEMDAETARRAAGWAAIDDVWMFGCFKWDWADMSTPVKAVDGSAVTTEYASSYGFENGRRYYFYNVLEELDSPGEWYLDRKNGLLYLWPPEGDFADARIDISLSTDTLIQGEGLRDVTFEGLTLQGTRGDGIRLKGDSITINHCAVRNIAGSAITLEGYGNTVSNNEIYRVGKQGVTISGGDAETLTPGNSRAVNNLVHDWPEVVMTYQGGVNVYGTGNLAAHNELYNSPHTAMFFGGNNNVIEYNLIHDVCLETDDAGAIYDGRSWWSAWGTVIRGNAIYNLGGDGHTPCGIYLDDGLSGVTVEGNLLVNVPGTAIAVSGRDLEVRGNVVVNAGRPVNYDQRTRTSALGESSWYFHAVEDGPQWQELWSSPWQTDVWKAAFPKLAAYTGDFNDADSPSFAANPAGSSVTGNTFAGKNKPGYDESVRRFSTTGPNESYGAPRVRDYWELPGYQGIPVEKIGRGANWG